MDTWGVGMMVMATGETLLVKKYFLLKSIFISLIILEIFKQVML